MRVGSKQRSRRVSLLLVVTFLAGTIVTMAGSKPGEAQDAPTGYDDTPMLPGQEWRVHDGDRPQPRVVRSGARFSESASPPADAVVLFDGSDLAQWQSRDGGEAAWKVENGYMEVIRGKGLIRTRDVFGDFQLHIEWATPAEVEGNSQGRGNSGVFLHGVYEVQVLDSYQNPTYPDGQAGALYGQTPPLVNSSRPPGEWQTYDILFEGARWQGDKVKQPARVTVIHNGVVLHHRKAYLGPTSHKRVGSYEEKLPESGPISLQDHGNPMRFRNIWIRPLGSYDR